MNEINLSAMFGGQFDDVIDLSGLWERTEAAPENNPIPAGWYPALVVKGERCVSSKGTPGYRLTFRVEDGEFVGRRLWQTLWLSANAVAYAKRDLQKLGIVSAAQLEAPYPPPGMRVHVRAQVALRVENDGRRRNDVRSFEFLRHEEEPQDPLAPTDGELGGDSKT